MTAAALRFPDRIETARLQLRRWRADDAPALRAAIDASDAPLRPTIPWMRGEPRTLEQTAERIDGFVAEFDAGRTFNWALWRDGALVGEVMLMTRAGPGALEIGYWLHVDHTGRGYVREALDALIPLADRAGIGRLEAWCAVGNVRSASVVRRLGFAVERQDIDGGVTYEVWVRAAG